MEENKKFWELSPIEQHKIIDQDLKEIADFLGGWDALSQAVERLKIAECERQYQNYVERFYS